MDLVEVGKYGEKVMNLADKPETIAMSPIKDSEKSEITFILPMGWG